MCVDPGLAGTGIAIFEDKKLLFWTNVYATPVNGNPWLFWKRVVEINTQIREIVREYRIYRAFIEWPTGQFSGKKGLAARNSDSILKLCYLIGYIKGRLDVPIALIPVVKHIGNLPKKVNHLRVKQYFKLDSNLKLGHAGDAISIGKYVIENNLC